MNKTVKKLVIAVVALSLVLVGVVGGVIAWLVAESGPVTNTFTYGKINITLDEAPVNEYGDIIEGARRDKNEYKLIPGESYTKDPIVHITEESEPCYVFVKVENGLVEHIDGNTIEQQMQANGWEQLSGNIWYYKGELSEDAVVDARTAQVDIPVFESFTLKGDKVTMDNIDEIAGLKIIITAYAVQSANTGTPAEAWAASGFGA